MRDTAVRILCRALSDQGRLWRPFKAITHTGQGDASWAQPYRCCSPPPVYVGRSRLRRFIGTLGVHCYHELLAWATTDPARFWDAAVRDLELEFYQQYTATLDLSRGLPWARWFEGGLYNYAHDAVDK